MSLNESTGHSFGLQVTVVTTTAESDPSSVMSVRACGAPSKPAAPVGETQLGAVCFRDDQPVAASGLVGSQANRSNRLVYFGIWEGFFLCHEAIESLKEEDTGFR